MSNFILYTYQCNPITNQGDNLFEKLPSIKERMDKKLEYIHAIITDNNFKFKSNKDGEFNRKIYYDQDGIIILRIANNKNLSLEEDFKKNKHHHSPSCFVIIDNRTNFQRIAIEEDTTAFSDTDVVRNIIFHSLKRHLQKYGLGIEIKKEFQKNEFWDIVKDQTRGISLVRFCFSYPNLPRVHQSINELINSESEALNSKQTTLEYRSNESEHLELDESNKQLSGLVEASAISFSN